MSMLEAAKLLMPAGAIYYNMDERDVRRVLSYPVSMIGSDGLPNDPMPHPRLWGAFPRVLGHYCRDEGLFPLTTAIHKMTGLSASRFRLPQRGLVKVGYFADWCCSIHKPFVMLPAFLIPNARQMALRL